MLDWLKINWEIVAIVIGGLGTAYNFLSEQWKQKMSSPFRKRQEKVVVENAELEQKQSAMDIIKGFGNDIVELQEQIITLRETLLKENKEKNKALLGKERFALAVKRQFREFIEKCELFCGQSEKCKEIVQKALNGLNIEKEEDE